MALWTGWKYNPPQGTPLDWTHPSTRNLQVCLPFNEGSGVPIDVAAPQYKPTTTGSPLWVGTPYGPAISTRYSGSVAYFSVPNRGHDWVTNTPFTLRMLVYPVSYQLAYATLVDTPSRDLSLFLDTTGAQNYYGYGGVSNPSTNALGLSVGSWWDISIVGVPSSATASTISYYRNGLSVGSDSVTGMSSFTDTLTFGNNVSSGGANVAGNYALVQYWNRALGQPEILSLYNSPWQIFAPPFPFWFGGSAAVIDPIGVASDTFTTCISVP